MEKTDLELADEYIDKLHKEHKEKMLIILDRLERIISNVSCKPMSKELKKLYKDINCNRI